MSIQRKFWSSLWASVALVVGACAACCTVPLVVVVLGAGAATMSEAIIEPLAVLAISGGLFLAALTVARRWRVRSAVACAPKNCCS